MITDSSIPPGWKWARLSEICDLNPALDRCFIDDAAEVHFVPMAAVDEEFGGVRRPERRVYGQVKKGYTPFVAGDVIIAKITPCMENGKGGVVNGSDDLAYFGSTEFHVLRPRAGIQPWWIGRFISQHSVRHAARLKMKGSAGQLRVPEDFLDTLVIPLAPVAEQIRILDRIDELFTDLAAGEAALERVKKKLKRYRSAVLHAAVTGRLTAEWRKTHGPPAEAGDKLLARILIERRRQWEQRTLAKYTRDGRTPPKNWQTRYAEPAAPKARDLPELPQGWSWASVDQLVIEGLCNGISVKGSDSPPGVAALKLNAMSERGFDYRAIRYLPIDRETFEENAVHEGDFYVSRGNGSLRLLARGTVAQRPPFPVVFPDTMIRVRLSSAGACVPTIWPSPFVRAQIERMAKTTAGIHKVSQADLSSVQFPLPPLVEQAAIVEAVNEKLSQIDAMEAEVERGLARTVRLRQAILKSAFEGQLVSQEPGDEPAANLLDRSKADQARVNDSRPPRPKRTRKMVSP